MAPYEKPLIKKSDPSFRTGLFSFATRGCGISSQKRLLKSLCSAKIESEKGGGFMEFGEKLSAARKAKGFSQEELAAKIDVSRQAVSKWENGTAQPETANILKLCETLEISPNELFGYEEKFSVSAGPKKKKSGKIFLVIIAAVILFFAFLYILCQVYPFHGGL